VGAANRRHPHDLLALPLGETLNKGKAGLIAVYAVNMADQIAASIKAENRFISKEIDAKADELAAQIKESQATES
jgi:hypothetical protein